MSALGPMQAAYDFWTPVISDIKHKPVGHFLAVIPLQVAEAMEQIKSGDARHAAAEVVDCISVCINWLRWMGYDDEGIAQAMAERATRYVDAKGIIEKYERTYGV